MKLLSARRIRSAATVLGVCFVFLVLAGSLTSCKRERVQVTPQLLGSVFDPPLATTDFTLTDQTGKPFTFSSTKGKLVIVTFLFTHCVDTCAYVSIKLRQIINQLGDDADKVEIVVISTDPEGDTVPVIAEYSKAIGLYDRWHYVTGTRAELEKVWKEWHIAVARLEKDDPSAAVAAQIGMDNIKGKTAPGTVSATTIPLTKVTDGLLKEDLELASRMISAFASGVDYDISHSVPFWILDENGFIRSSFSSSALPSQVVFDVKTLWSNHRRTKG